MRLCHSRLTRGLSETVPFDAPGRAAGLAISEPGELAACGAGRRGAPAGPDVAPEWARVRRAGAGHDDPHGAARRGGGGEREVRSIGREKFNRCGFAVRRRVGLTWWASGPII